MQRLESHVVAYSLWGRMLAHSVLYLLLCSPCGMSMKANDLQERRLTGLCSRCAEVFMNVFVDRVLPVVPGSIHIKN